VVNVPQTPMRRLLYKTSHLRPRTERWGVGDGGVKSIFPC
jgi:hypothetical protein